MFTRSALFAAAAAALVSASAGSAAAPAAGRSTEVSFSDLDLASASGAAMLETRIRRAAASVCGTYDARDLPGIARRNSCRKSAIEGSRPQVELAIAAARNQQIASASHLTVAAH